MPPSDLLLDEILKFSPSTLGLYFFFNSKHRSWQHKAGRSPDCSMPTDFQALTSKQTPLVGDYVTENSPTLYWQRGPNIPILFSYCPPVRTKEGRLEAHTINKPLLLLHQLLSTLTKLPTELSAETTEGFLISSSGSSTIHLCSSAPRGRPSNAPCGLCRTVTQQCSSLLR